MFTNGFGWPHILIIAVLLILFFGAKRLPDAARGLGKSMRIFRAETRGMHEDETAATGNTAAPQPPPQQLSAPQQSFTADQTNAQHDQQR